LWQYPGGINHAPSSGSRLVASAAGPPEAAAAAVAEEDSGNDSRIIETELRLEAERSYLSVSAANFNIGAAGTHSTAVNRMGGREGSMGGGRVFKCQGVEASLRSLGPAKCQNLAAELSAQRS
jgi:hypothetical protein